MKTASNNYLRLKRNIMRVLIIGSGGREHALAWKLALSPLVDKIFIAPGNGGTSEAGENVNIAADDIDSLVNFAKKEDIDLVAPGPELPLTLGITDAMNKAGIKCFGPDAFCAQMEGSKSFAKEIMAKAGVPTAKAKTFTDAAAAKEYIQNGPAKVVVKADGLAAGKGVIVAQNKAEALAAIEDMLVRNAFGNAGAKVLIEEMLEGEEVSLLAFCDGDYAAPLPSAQDHKAAYDDDTGPNTGGMGAYSPAPILPDSQLQQMVDTVIRPILKTLKEEGHPFKGVLYAGLMITKDGPKVLEYNARFGDPECQPLLSRLTSDLASHMLACCDGKLQEEQITFSPQSAVGIVLASEGYPGKYAKGMPIANIEEAEKCAKAFHSGTKRSDSGLKSDGGRVLCVTALGDTLAAARDKAYEAISRIEMPHSRYRKDIADKGLARQKLMRHN